MSKCWYCNEELTTANYCEDHMGICTKCYGSMFKVGNDFVKGLTDKIADLEAKLAESEKDRLMWQEMYKSADRQNKEICETDIYPLQEENAQLKQQLAEKDKEIEDLRHFKITIGTTENNQVDISSTTYADQDKISFAIDELVKVKNFVNYRHFDFVPDGLIERFEVEKKIDNQIEELKKGFD